MNVPFAGKWRGTVTGRNAGFSQRVVVSGAASGNGAYEGVVGTSFVFEDGQVELQWNNEAGSGWQESAIISSIGMSSPLVVVSFLSADDNFPDQRDGDYDDLQVSFEHLDPAFEVLQRPFALERGSLVMLPDGIFDASQGVQYMGVRLRNTWFFNWTSLSMKVAIAPASRGQLAAAGVNVLDVWTPLEQQALGQVVDGGFVRVPDLNVGEDTTVYFKVDAMNAGPSKPDVGLVAQRDAFDPAFDAPTRVEHKRVFISRSSFDKTTKELVASLPEGTLRLKLSSIALDLKAANDAAKDLIACLRKHGSGSGSWWERGAPSHEECLKLGSAVLRRLLEDVLAGRDVDLCELQDVLDRCCRDCDCDSCDGGGEDGDGWQDGTGVDGWCRVKPVVWLPFAFDYRLEPNPPYTGQHGRLAFEDPWWKIVLIILAILLYVASLVYDYVEAGQDPRFIIGRIARNGDANANSVDCAVCDLNGSRGVDLGELDAQGDDANSGLPIEGLDTIIQLDRTDNGDSGIQDAVLHNVVWKSGGRSGTTRGQVESLVHGTFINYDTEDTITGQVNYTNQVLVTQITGMEQPVSQAGDSGSVWVDMATAPWP